MIRRVPGSRSGVEGDDEGPEAAAVGPAAVDGELDVGTDVEGDVGELVDAGAADPRSSDAAVPQAVATAARTKTREATEARREVEVMVSSVQRLRDRGLNHR